MAEWLAVACMLLMWALGFWTAWSIAGERRNTERHERLLRWVERRTSPRQQDGTSGDSACAAREVTD